MTRSSDDHARTLDRRFLAALALCCAGPMLLIVVLTSALGVAIGPAAAITLGLVTAGLCVAVMARHHRHPPLTDESPSGAATIRDRDRDVR
jgi:hypothetical protein